VNPSVTDDVDVFLEDVVALDDPQWFTRSRG